MVCLLLHSSLNKTFTRHSFQGKMASRFYSQLWNEPHVFSEQNNVWQYENNWVKQLNVIIQITRRALKHKFLSEECRRRTMSSQWSSAPPRSVLGPPWQPSIASTAIQRPACFSMSLLFGMLWNWRGWSAASILHSLQVWCRSSWRRQWLSCRFKSTSHCALLRHETQMC